MAKMEAHLWDYVQGGMHQYWLPTRHEERGIALGVPDVSYAVTKRFGWLELKATTIPTTKIIPRIMRPEQIQWLTSRWKVCDGGCFILLWMVPDIYLLLPGEIANNINKAHVKSVMAAGKAWLHRINFKEMAMILTKGCIQ